MNDDPTTHWESVYATRGATDVSWFQPHADRSLALIDDIAAGQACRLIDVGAGASTLVDDLVATRGHQVTVLDLSATALGLVRERLGARAAAVDFIAGDVTRVALPAGAFDIWHDRAVFHFLTTPEQRAAYVAQVRRALRPGGHVIVAAFSPDGPTECSGLPVMRYAPEALHGEFGGAFELLGHVAEAHHTPWGAVQSFVYCHCVRH